MTDWKPSRPDPEHRKCSICVRVFAGFAPAPDAQGPYAGKRVCRDCRELLDGIPPNPLF